MAKYSGPRLKILRKLGTDLPGLTRKEIGKRKNKPGEHGANQYRISDYGLRLNEKQKVKYSYGLTETQMRRYFEKAKKSKANKGVKFLTLLESRLDNVVFRAGFAPTIPAARQLVSHRHVLVNDSLVNVPGMQVKHGDTISLHPKARNIPSVMDAVGSPSIAIPTYLAIDSANFSAKVINDPERSDIPLDINESLIVEFYSK